MNAPREDLQSMMNDAPNAPVVELLVKDQYGRKAYHPVSQAAQHFAAIAGTKTLTMETIKHIIALGFTVLYTHTPYEVTP